MSAAMKSAQDEINARLARAHKKRRAKSLTAIDKEKARVFLRLIACAVATRGSDDPEDKEWDQKEVDGFNILAEWLGGVKKV
jgi:hypothetical protein